MSLFGSIMSKIFGGGTASAQTAAPPATGAQPASPTSSIGASLGAGGAAAPATGGGSTTQSVDVGQVLSAMAAKKGENLNYQQSIVDLLKLLDLDSSLSARKQLADELHYTGDKEDSASMNVWLHKAVVRKLAENGGKIPADMQRA